MCLKDPSLPPDILNIIRGKATEPPHSGAYTDLDKPGTYLCRGCGLALFRAQSKFQSSCGWPSFDEAIPDAVLEEPDQDGIRTELLCGRCLAHLGHVFIGEHYTAKNRRYCVNSLSLDFVESLTVQDTEEAILAAGCFWGVQYYFERLSGIVKTEVGYSGGTRASPTYREVCEGHTGHLEVLRVVYDSNTLSYEDVIKYFFEIHDATQRNGQGPDVGEQYQSAIFYFDEIQKQTARQVIQLLEKSMGPVATQLKPVCSFWPAEQSHQHYYQKNQHTPYCHTYTKRFK